MSYRPEIGSLVGLWTYRGFIVGTIVRTIPHASTGAAIAPGCVVDQWIAVRRNDPS